MVYNKDFIERNFSQDKIKGIFTLGTQNVEDVENLLSLNVEKTKHQDSIAKKRNSLKVMEKTMV